MKPNTKNTIGSASNKNLKVWKKPVFELLYINKPLDFFKLQPGIMPPGS